MVSETIKLKKDDTKHIVLSIWDLTDSYNRHASVTMVSILENTQSPVHFHLLYDEQRSESNQELAEINYNRYMELEEKYGAKIDFHHVSVPKSVKDLPLLRVYTEGTLLRFFIPDLFQKYDKVLYLDTDIVVRTDIAALWDIDISGNSVAAMKMNLSKSYRRKYLKHGINPDNYFNAGVILFNLEYIRHSSNLKADDFFKHLLTHPKFEWLDQDVLNLCFCDSVYHLPKKYNKCTGLRDRTDYNDVILHFAGRLKPWKVYLGGADRYYWKYLLQSPWGDNVEDVISYLLDAPNMETSLNRIPIWLAQMYPRELIGYLCKFSIKIPLIVLWHDIKYLVYHKILGKNAI